MNTQTGRKIKFPIGALLLAIVGVYNLISIITSIVNYSEFYFDYIVSLVTSVCLILPFLIIILKKTTQKIIAVPFIIYAVIDVILIFLQAGSGDISIPSVIWAFVEICALLMCIYSGVMPDAAKNHYLGSVVVISLIFSLALLVNNISAFSYSIIYGLISICYPIGIFLFTIWALDPYSKNSMTTKEKTDNIFTSFKANLSEGTTKVALIIIAIGIVAIIALCVSRSSSSSSGCSFVTDGVTCGDKRVSGSPYCEHHKELMDAYEDVKDRYEQLTDQHTNN